MQDLESWLEKVYEAGGDRQTLDQLYNQWATEYDQQIWASGNPYVAIMAGFCGRFLQDFDGHILDAGCGTGNMAQLLNQVGFSNIDGLDPSEGMLAVAADKGVYRNLHMMFLGSTIDLPGDSYDAVVAAGVLTHGHAPPESLDGMIDVVKPGGAIVFSLSEIAFNDFGFGDKISELEEQRKWQKLDRSRLFRTYPFSEKEAHLRHWVYAFRKC